MKKLVALLLAMLLLMGSVACGKENTNTIKNNGSTDEPTESSKLEMPIIRKRPASPEGEVDLPSYEVEALIEVAKAYIARTIANQYEDSFKTAFDERWFIPNKESAGDLSVYSPESATSQNTYYASCSPFIRTFFGRRGE